MNSRRRYLELMTRSARTWGPDPRICLLLGLVLVGSCQTPPAAIVDPEPSSAVSELPAAPRPVPTETYTTESAIIEVTRHQNGRVTVSTGIPPHIEVRRTFRKLPAEHVVVFNGVTIWTVVTHDRVDYDEEGPEMDM